MGWAFLYGTLTPPEAVKPLALMRWLVKLVAREGETILDPFLGSGTTAVACAQTGRKCIGMELDAGYLAIARQRLVSVTSGLFDEAPTK